MFSKVTAVPKPAEAIVPPVAARVAPPKTDDFLTRGTGVKDSFN